jgi:hypothetical protein
VINGRSTRWKIAAIAAFVFAVSAAASTSVAVAAASTFAAVTHSPWPDGSYSTSGCREGKGAIFTQPVLHCAVIYTESSLKLIYDVSVHFNCIHLKHNFGIIFIYLQSCPVSCYTFSSVRDFSMMGAILTGVYYCVLVQV